MILYVLANLLCLQTSGAQLLMPDAPFNATCDLLTLPSRIQHLNEACPVGQCDTSCVPVLIPLLADCRTFLNQIYDGQDGVFDGEFRPLSDVYGACLEIPIPELIDNLKSAVHDGKCQASDLDGVSQSGLKAEVCEDVWKGRCAATLDSGVMTCDVDFCSTTETCHFAGLCDRTCNFCTDDGGRRLQLGLLGTESSSPETELPMKS
eukprot:SAG11_NODE_6071_length_1394_cov_1.796911_1_plen_206_part_00